MRRRLLFLALAATAACDVPTESPLWEQTWQVPAEEIRISVGELVPAGVDLNADSSAFVVGTPSAQADLALAQACNACTPFFGAGAPFPKPAFTAFLSTTALLPEDVVAAELAGGMVDVVLSHDFGFDPLNPGSGTADRTGYLLLRVRSDGNVIVRDSIDGADQTLAPGETLTRELQVRTGTVADNLTIELELFSPAGDPITASGDEALTLAVLPGTVELGAVTVVATAVSVDATAADLDFGGLDESQIDRVRSGAVIVDVVNPFAVEGSFDLSFDLPSGPAVTRSVGIEQGSYRTTLDYSGQELRSILSSDDVTILAAGAVSAPAGTITVAPDQELVLDTSFRLILLVGGSDEEG